MSNSSNQEAFNGAHDKVCKLIEHFASYAEVNYLQPSYQESEVRKDFIDPLFKALGWDVDHECQHNPYEQEVKVESSLRVANASAQKRADYAFYLTPNFRDVRFYVEAKKPSIDLDRKAEAHFQTLRYGYSAGTPLAVLTDFEQIRVLDCRCCPNLKDALEQVYVGWHYTDFRDKENFARFYYLFSREAHADGSYQRRIDELPKLKGSSKQRRLFGGGYQPVDESFLLDLAKYREKLAKAFKDADLSLDSAALTKLVQRAIDRLVFMRFLEDKQIETEISVSKIGNSKNAWEAFQDVSHRLDNIYNGIVFKPLEFDDKRFKVDHDVFGGICKEIAAENSPYNFDAIPIHILGSIYERFLGSVICITENQVKVEAKPEVLKAGGVYYTPEYIVRYIVEQTVGNIIRGKAPADIAIMKFADIACGSGSFLLGIFDELLRHHAEWYNQPGRDKLAKRDGCIKTEDGHWKLSLMQRRDILQNNIYGVDLDRQAVEVAQLSLFLKLLESERAESTHQYLLDFARDANMNKLLPDLSGNIVCGNSLIGWDVASKLNLAEEQEVLLNPLDFEVVFPQVMREGGFDAIVGNPPYFSIDKTWGKNDFRIKAIKTAYPLIHNDKTDVLFYFLARATQLSKHGIGYIVSRAFLEAYKADKLRSWLLEKTSIRHIVDFRNTIIFKSNRKSVGITTCIVDLVVGGTPEQITVHKRRKDQPLEPPLNKALSDPEQFDAIQVPQEQLGRNPWELTLNEDARINDRLDSAGMPLGNVLSIGQGMQTGSNGVFGRRSLNEIEEWNVPNDYFFKRATNTDINRYQIKDRGEYLLYPNAAASFSNLPAGVQAHLTAHSAKLKKRAAHQRGNCKWWQYTWPLHAEHYGIRKRILCPYLASENHFALDENDEFIGLTDTTVLFDNDQPEDLLYLLGLLNSRLLTFRFRSIGKLKSGNMYEYFWNSVSRLPIRRIDFSNRQDIEMHNRLVTLVGQMLEAKRQETLARGNAIEVAMRRCAALDRQIDGLVYELYELSEEEINLVENM